VPAPAALTYAIERSQVEQAQALCRFECSSEHSGVDDFGEIEERACDVRNRDLIAS
jgi:hypothetical protein